MSKQWSNLPGTSYFLCSPSAFHLSIFPLSPESLGSIRFPIFHLEQIVSVWAVELKDFVLMKTLVPLIYNSIMNDNGAYFPEI